MTHPNTIKSRSQDSTAEEYTRRFILRSFQLIFSHSDDILVTRYGLDAQHFCDSTRLRRT